MIEALPGQVAGAARAGGKSWPWWALAAAAVVAVSLAAYFGYLLSQPKPLIRAYIKAPDKTTFLTTLGYTGGVPVISPDGTKVAFVARDEAGKSVLYVRRLNELAGQAIAGTEGASHPFWSPDNENLGFFAGGKLKRVDVAGGPPQVLADAPVPRGGTWSPEGVIVFAPSNTAALMRVSAAGGTVAPATRMATETAIGTHRFPNFLPDGKHFLFWSGGGGYKFAGVRVGSLDSPDSAPVQADVFTQAIYAPPGYLLFVRNGTLMAAHFSLRALKVTSDAVPVAENISVSPGFNLGLFSVSNTGILVYQSGATEQPQNLNWFDREGKRAGTIDLSGWWPVLSPDGKRLAISLQTESSGRDVWVYDLVRNVRTRLTFSSGMKNFLTWTPDGKKVIYGSDREGQMRPYAKAADGSGTEEKLIDGGGEMVSVSPDGQFLAYDTNSNMLMAVRLTGDRKPSPIIDSHHEQTPAISPDGKWLAYSSNASGREDVFITAFPGGGARWQVSISGGTFPRWRRDGKELFFLSDDQHMMAVDVTETAASVSLGTPHALFLVYPVSPLFGPYDVTADGKKFLVNTLSTVQGNEPLTLVVNWPELLKK